jgi:hypothetical protein
MVERSERPDRTAPSSEGNANLLCTGSPEVQGMRGCKAVHSQGREGDERREKLLTSAQEREDLRGQKSQESKGPDLN